MNKININISYEEILRRKERWEKAVNFEKLDRLPVLFYISSRYWLPLIGYKNRFKDYFNNPKLMLEAQLQGQKWILENVKSDFHNIVLFPDFMWIEDVDSFGAEIVISDDDSPWVKRPHYIKNEEDLEKLEVVDYIHNGTHGRMISYYEQMKTLANDYEICFSDGKVLNAKDFVYMSGGGITGPNVIAGDLRGVEEYSMDFFDRPKWVKELLRIIADKSIKWMDYARKMSNGKVAFASDYHRNVAFIGDDGTAQMSPKQFKEFAMEPLKQLSNHFHSQGLKVMAHNCGKADHTLKYWAEDIKIDRYYGFSYLTDKNLLNEIMGGKVVLIGGLNSIKLHDGSPEDVRGDVKETLEVLKNTPGFILMDGHNIAPGTPLDNLNAVMEAVENYGRF